MSKLLILTTLCLLAVTSAGAQGTVGLKTNVLYGAGTFTPNLGMEVGLGKRTTLDILGGYNWFNLNGTAANNKKRVHWMVQSEFRYFLCERFNGHFFGVHALYSRYNIGQHALPLLFGQGSQGYRFEGNSFGGGVSYGYQLMLGRDWDGQDEALFWANQGRDHTYLSNKVRHEGEYIICVCTVSYFGRSCSRGSCKQ